MTGRVANLAITAGDNVVGPLNDLVPELRGAAKMLGCSVVVIARMAIHAYLIELRARHNGGVPFPAIDPRTYRKG